MNRTTVLNEALGVSVRITQESTGYGMDEYDEVLFGEILVGGVTVFRTHMQSLEWKIGTREDELVQDVIQRFAEKIASHD